LHRPLKAVAAAAARMTPENLYDRLTLALVTASLVLVAWTFGDYGITTDEYVQHTYGEKLWAFYLSGMTDRAVFAYDNLYLYGGLFDMVAVALGQVSPWGEYETRHLLCGLIGVLGVVGVWRLARLLAGPRAGFLAAALLALSASWYGSMFNNTKDIPFAVGMTWLLYFSCRIIPALPRPALGDVIWLGVATGLSLGIRVGGFLGVICLATAIAAHLAIVGWRQDWRAAVRDGLLTVRYLLPALPIAYLLMAAFWPWSVLSPLNPIDALSGLFHFPVTTPFDGHFYPATNLPFAYLPVYIAIKLPEVVLAGMLAAICLFAADLVRRRVSIEDAAVLPWFTLVFAIALPLTYFLIGRPAIYNGMRHFFFLVPPLCVMAAFGLDRLWRLAEQRRRWLGAVVAGLLLAVAGREMATMTDLHPNEYVYYNVMVGGPGGAFRRFEMDYWSNFIPEALAALDQQLRLEARGKPPKRVYTVGVCTSEDVFREYRTPYLVVIKDWSHADFIIPTTNGNCDKYARGHVVAQVSRMGAVLGVVKDRRAGMTAAGGTNQRIR
jgi:dolichyl-phosphate-mannose-protein mannosyltransferase